MASPVSPASLAAAFGALPDPRRAASVVYPPNAALVADTAQQQDAVSLVELLNPSYDATSHPLTYEANLLHQYPNVRGSALASLAPRAQGAPPADIVR